MNKRIEINSVLTTEGKIVEVGLFRHVGHTPIDAVMWQALREYLRMHPQKRSLNIHLFTRSFKIKLYRG